MNTRPTEFSGRGPRQAKRRALNYWYTNRGRLGLSLSEFLGRCRVSSQEGLTRITFYDEREAA